MPGGAGVITRHYFADRQGNVLAVANANGTLHQRFAYTPFGVELTGEASGNPFRYTGQRFDPGEARPREANEGRGRPGSTTTAPAITTQTWDVRRGFDPPDQILPASPSQPTPSDTQTSGTSTHTWGMTRST